MNRAILLSIALSLVWLSGCQSLAHRIAIPDFSTLSDGNHHGKLIETLEYHERKERKAIKRAGTLRVLRAEIGSNVLYPGDSTVIVIEVEDKKKIISRIEGRIDEDARIVYSFYDNGTEGDEKGGDSIWSCKVDVPEDAPQGAFTLQFLALDRYGSPISMRFPDSEANEEASKIRFSIRHAADILHEDHATSH